MRFEQGEELRVLERSVEEFARKHVEPYASAWEHEGRVPASFVAELADAGLLGMTLTGEAGGAGLSPLAECVALQRLAEVDGSTALLVAWHGGLALRHVALQASEAVRERWLAEWIAGQRLATWTAMDAGPEPTLARREGTGFVVTGGKARVVAAGQADVFVVTARADDGRELAFAIERSASGVAIDASEATLGMRAASLGTVRLHGVRVEADACLELEAIRPTLEAHARLSLASIALGLGRAAFRFALAYARTREQFGQPIAEFQAIQWKLADVATALEAAALLVARAASEREGPALERRAAAAKVFAATASVKACQEALQIHGGYGYTEEFPIERRLRDAYFCTIGFSPVAFDRREIARHLSAAR